MTHCAVLARPTSVPTEGPSPLPRPLAGYYKTSLSAVSRVTAGWAAVLMLRSLPAPACLFSEPGCRAPTARPTFASKLGPLCRSCAGTGKEDGDRHPKISDNVLIGASARILGNIRIGRSAQVGERLLRGWQAAFATPAAFGGSLPRRPCCYCCCVCCYQGPDAAVLASQSSMPLNPTPAQYNHPQVAAGSTVLREVPPRTLVAGAPAREIGAITGNPALDMDQIQADTQVG